MGESDTQRSWNPSTIKGPYQLIAAALIVVEVGLGGWVYIAESQGERITAACIFITVFGIAVFAAIKLMKKHDDSDRLGAETRLVEPPKGEATEQEIANPGPGSIAGPDGSFLIQQPPDGWVTRILSLDEWMEIVTGLSTFQEASSGTDVDDSISADSTMDKEVMLIEKRTPFSVFPIPGRTTIDDRLVPTALEVPGHASLTILPMLRAQQPLYTERTIEHNFLAFVAQTISSGVLTARNLNTGMKSQDGRRSYSVEFTQDVKNAIVNNKEGSDVTLNIVILGVEGELKDHIIIVRYPMQKGNIELERDHAVLQELISSFRSLKILDLEDKKKQMTAMANANFRELMKAGGESIFYRELSLLLLRVSKANLDDQDQRLRVMNMLKPFEIMSKDLGIADSELNDLWVSLAQAVNGDARELKENLKELMEYVATDPEDEE